MDVTVVFVEPEHPENIGNIARVMKNFGFYKLILVNPQCEITEKAYIVAKHAKDVLERAKILDTLDDALKLFDLNIGTTGKFTTDENIIRAVIPSDILPKILSKYTGKVGLYIGRESIGFTNEELMKFDLIVTISTNPEYPIMNASHAAAVLLYELYKAVRNPVRERIRLAKRKTKDEIYKIFDKLIDKLNIKEFRKPYIRRVLWNLINKSFISEREAQILKGFLMDLLSNTPSHHNQQ